MVGLRPFLALTHNPDKLAKASSTIVSGNMLLKSVMLVYYSNILPLSMATP